ncbi:MAG: DUF1326 domain-containing protein [Bryobacterales bacterium]|nr:DUF1326 domain-containing protein [Bryobacterales bacterium]
MKILLTFVLAGGLAIGASLPSKTISGEYIEARTADIFTGPCFANAETGLIGELAVFGWKVRQGSWQGVDLTGLSVVAAVRANTTLGDVYTPHYPVKSVVIVDERATPEQRLALASFARKVGGELLADVTRVDAAPIELTFENNNIHTTKAKLTAGTLATIETRAINEGDHICRNEEIWSPPLNKTDHAMPAVAVSHTFSGQGLGTQWSSPNKRSSFVGSFQHDSE